MLSRVLHARLTGVPRNHLLAASSQCVLLRSPRLSFASRSPFSSVPKARSQTDPSNLPFQPLPMSDTQPASQIDEESLTATLRSKLDTTHLQIQDISGGCGQSFTALIVSSEFAGKSALQRHRLVNAALKDEIKEIHAWTPRCLTPEQFEKEQGAARED